MLTKSIILGKLNSELEQWQDLLGNLNADNADSIRLNNGHSVKDVVAHLMMWQKVSIARLEAAHNNRNFVYMPSWHPKFDPKSDAERDRINAAIYENQKDRAWEDIYAEWRDGFQQLYQIAEQIPEDNYFDTNKYDFLFGYCIADILLGSYEHHHLDHYPDIAKVLS